MTRNGRSARPTRGLPRLSLLVQTSVLLTAFVTGCSSEEEPPNAGQATRDGTTASPASEARDQPEEQEPKPASTQPSPQEQAARIAFQTMTSPGVSTEEWEAANQKLQEIGPPALPVLVEGLGSEETVRREMASTVLALFGPAAEPAAQELIKALEDKSIFVRANVAAALLQMPEHVDRVVPVLAEFLAGEDVELRRMAATNLAAVDIEQARPLMPQLITALDDSDREVVYYAVQLLGRMGPDAAMALPKLRALANHEDPQLKSAVETAILQIELTPAAEGAPDPE